MDLIDAKTMMKHHLLVLLWVGVAAGSGTGVALPPPDHRRLQTCGDALTDCAGELTTGGAQIGCYVCSQRELALVVCLCIVSAWCGDFTKMIRAGLDA